MAGPSAPEAAPKRVGWLRWLSLGLHTLIWRVPERTEHTCAGTGLLPSTRFINICAYRYHTYEKVWATSPVIFVQTEASCRSRNRTQKVPMYLRLVASVHTQLLGCVFANITGNLFCCPALLPLCYASHNSLCVAVLFLCF